MMAPFSPPLDPRRGNLSSKQASKAATVSRNYSSLLPELNVTTELHLKFASLTFLQTSNFHIHGFWSFSKLGLSFPSTNMNCVFMTHGEGLVHKVEWMAVKDALWTRYCMAVCYARERGDS